MSTEKINLAELKSNYLTLGEAVSVTFTGKYTGDRLVIRNASGKRLFFTDGSIHTTHEEDALVFADKLTDCTIHAERFSLFFGGLTCWDKLENVKIDGLQIYFPHTGIRATGDKANKDVSIRNCTIQSASHEGIYMGVSIATPLYSDRLTIENNKVSQTGWDGIQVGNWKNAWIVNNEITQAGMAGEWGQWHAVCINPGSQVWLWNNQIQITTKHYIINEATAYMENPKTKI